MAEGNERSGKSFGGRKGYGHGGSGRPGGRGGYGKSGGFRRDGGKGGFRKDFHKDGERRDFRRDERRDGGFRRDGEDRREGGFRKDFHKGPRRDGERRDFRRDGERRDFRRDGERREGGFRRDDRRDGGRGGFRKDFRKDGERRDFRRDGERREGGFRRDERREERKDFHKGPRRDDRHGSNPRYQHEERREERRAFNDEEKREYREQKRREYMQRGPRRNSDGTMSFPSQNPYTDRRPGEPKMPKGMTWSMLSSDERERLRGLSKEHAENIGLHILAAYTLIETDEQAALEHAKWVARQASRVDIARETLAFIAYRCGDYKLALREFRTAYRMNGYPDYLPFIADCERGVGNPKKAIELAVSDDAKLLRGDAKAEMFLVYAGALGDLERWDKAIEIVHTLGRSKGLGGGHRMRALQAEQLFLEEAGRSDEAMRLDDVIERLEDRYADFDEDEDGDDVVIDHDLELLDDPDLLAEIGITEDDAQYAPVDEDEESEDESEEAEETEESSEEGTSDTSEESGETVEESSEASEETAEAEAADEPDETETAEESVEAETEA